MYKVDYEYGMWFVFKGGLKVKGTESTTREAAEAKLKVLKNQVKK